MQKKITMLLFLLLLINLLRVGFPIENVRANGHTLYVGGIGPGNYTSIQDAIDNASNGDTVFVYDDSSPYCENVVVNKSINLIGEDKKNNRHIHRFTTTSNYTININSNCNTRRRNMANTQRDC